MTFIDNHQQLLVSTKVTIRFNNYVLLWLVFFQRVFLALVLERLIFK